MKKLILSAVGIVCLVGVYFIGSARGQNGATPAPAANVPHKVGLIDMGHVFKEYKKFDILREDLKVKIQENEQKAKGMADRITAIQAELKSGTFKEGSPEFLNREREFTKLTSEFETFRKLAQQDFLRDESKIYHQIYLEVQDAVEKFSNHFQYTLILRFNREDLNSSDPQKLLNGLNRQVIHFRGEDDITDSVVEYLNRRYSAPASAAPKATPKTATPTGTANPPVRQGTLPNNSTKKN